jgi:hypothetical protein
MKIAFHNFCDTEKETHTHNNLQFQTYTWKGDTFILPYMDGKAMSDGKYYPI